MRQSLTAGRNIRLELIGLGYAARQDAHLLKARCDDADEVFEIFSLDTAESQAVQQIVIQRVFPGQLWPCDILQAKGAGAPAGPEGRFASRIESAERPFNFSGFGGC